MLSSMLEAHVKVAAGDAADKKGFLLQVSAPYGLIATLASEALPHVYHICNRSGVLSTADSGWEVTCWIMQLGSLLVLKSLFK